MSQLLLLAVAYVVLEVLRGLVHRFATYLVCTEDD